MRWSTSRARRLPSNRHSSCLLISVVCCRLYEHGLRARRDWSLSAIISTLQPRLDSVRIERRVEQWRLTAFAA